MIEFGPTPHSHPAMTYHCGDDSHLGAIPAFFDQADPRPARDQVNERYAHGGGWQPYGGFRPVAGGMQLRGHPEDPPLYAVAEAKLRDETIRLFQPGSWLGIFQPDGSFEIARCD
jgi:hypothetical protein